MDRIFIPVYRFFHQKKWLMYSILIISTAVFLFFGLQVRYEEDISKLLPQTDAATESGLAFGDLRVKDKIFLLITSKETKSDTQVLSEYAEEFFSGLLEKDTATHYIDNILYHIDDDLMINGLDYALSHVPSFVDLTCYDSFDTLSTKENIYREMIRNAALIMEDEDGSISTMIGQDPIALRKALLETGKRIKEGLGGYAVLDGYFFTPDSTVALAFLSPHFKSFDSKSGNRLVSMLEKEIQDFEELHPDAEILFHGAPIQSVFNARRIKADLLMTIGVSLILICLFIGFCMKGKSTPFLLLSPIIYGTLLSLTCIYFIKGSMSLMAMGIGAIVLGVALSYCLHVLTHYKYISNPVQVIKDQSTPVCLGCLTTIGAFSGLLFTESELLKDFGLFASLAMVGTTLYSLIFLPHFFTPEKNKKSEKAFALFDKVNSYRYDRNVYLIVFILLVSAISIYTSRLVKFDSDLKNIGYNEEKVVRSRQIFEEKNLHGNISQYFASSAPTLDQALENNKSILRVLDSLQSSGILNNYSRTSSLFISMEEQESRIDAWKNYWNEDKIAQVRKEVTQAAENNDLNPMMFEPFYIMLESDYEAESLFEAGILPESLLSNFVEKSDSRYLVFTAVNMPPESKKEVCKTVAAEKGAVVIDPFFYTNDMVEILSNDFNTIAGISSIFVLLVLLISFKNFWISLIAFIPMSLSWIIVQGIMGIFGLEFNLINIIIATFIFGIGVDYSIFMMDGLLSEKIATGKSKELLSYHKTAILFSAIVLIVVVGSLVFATHPAINSIGITTLIGMSSTILITYTIEPLLFRVYWKIRENILSKHGKE